MTAHHIRISRFDGPQRHCRDQERLGYELVRTIEGPMEYHPTMHTPEGVAWIVLVFHPLSQSDATAARDADTEAQHSDGSAA